MAEILLPNSERPVMTVPHAFVGEPAVAERPVIPMILHPHPFESRKLEVMVPHGATVRDMVRLGGFPAVYDPYVRVWIGDVEVPREWWDRVRPKQGAHVYVRITPQGGKQQGGGKGGGKGILGSILMLVVVVAAAFLAPIIAGYAGFTAGTTAFAIAKGAIGLGLTLLGGLLVQSLVKPPKQNKPADTTPISQRALLTGIQNRFEPYAYIPRIFGKRRLYPLQAAKPYTEAVGANRYVRALLCVGFGPLDISDIKIGDTPISAFANIEYEVREGWTDSTFGALPSGKSADAAQTLFTNSVTEESFNVLLTTGVNTIRTTAVNTSEISIDVTFPQGLAVYDQNGNRTELQVNFEVYYRLVGTSGWTAVTWNGNDVLDGTATNGALQCKDKSGASVTFGGHWKTGAPGQYEVLIIRDSDMSTSNLVVDRSEWTSLRSIRYQSPITITGVAYIAFRMRATDQFQGLPDQINCVATSYLPQWDGSTWTYGLSRNPAWAYVDMMRRRGVDRVIADSRIDLPTIKAWADACAATAPNASEPRWTIDAIYEGGAIFGGLREIAAMGRAAFVANDGKYSVVRDIPQTVPVAHITPRNSWGYSGSKTFVDYPHAFRVNFINADKGWQDDERIVYADGYDATNATKYETLDLPGCTSPTLAWREARYHLAVGLLRPEEHEVSQDIEALRCTAGDLVLLAHDVLSIGLAQGRINTILTSGANCTGFVLDCTVPMLAGVSYGLRVRKADGSSVFYTLASVGSDTEAATVTLAPVIPASAAPAEGDLFMFGEASRETAPMIVKKIAPGQDFSARLTLVDAQPGVHTADTGTIPPFDSNITDQTPPQQQRPPLPTYNLTSDETVLARLADGSLDARILVNVTQLASSSVTPTLIEVQYRVTGQVSYFQAALVPVRQRQIYISGVKDSESYDVRVRTLTDYGLASDWAETLAYKAIGKTTPPPDVAGFTINVVDGQAHLTWNAVTVLDLAYYKIRHSPSIAAGVSFSDAIDVAPNVPASATSVVVPAMTGTYFIKAVDVVGLVSINAAATEVILDNVKGLNAVATTNEAGFPGTRTGLDRSDGALVLGSTVNFDDVTGLFDSGVGLFDGSYGHILSTGTYDFSAPIDLGAVYTSRVTAILNVSRVDYANLFDYADGLFDDRPGNIDGDDQIFDDTNVEVYLATSQGDPALNVWSEWRRFTVGDYTARAFKFRLILTSTDAYASPAVSSAVMTVDMPDRTARGADLSSGAGLSITFSPAFNAPPAIAIAAQNLTPGDFYVITGKSAAGFTITFKDSTGTVVDRAFDWTAVGYGELAA